MPIFEGQGDPNLTTTARPQYPYQGDNSSEVAARGLSSTLSSLGEATTGLLDQAAVNRGNEATNSFLQEQLRLADAVDQGLISSKEARMRARANVATALNDNPSNAGSITKAHKEFITTSGLGKVVADGTEQEQRLKTEMDDAHKAGFLQPGVPVEEGLAAYRSQVSELQTLKIMQERRAIRIQNMNISKAERERQDKIDLKTGREALTNLAAIQTSVLNDKLRTLHSDFVSGSNGLTAEQAVLTANSMLEEIRATANQASGGQNINTLSELIKPMEKMVAAYTNVFTGTSNTTALENEVKSIKARTELMILADPEARNFVVTSNILGNPPSMVAAQNGFAARLLSNLNKGVPQSMAGTDPDQIESVQGALTAIKEGMKVYNGGGDGINDQKALDAELNNLVTNVLGSTSAHRLAVSNPEDFNSMVEFFSSAEANKYFVNAGGIPKDEAMAAAQVFEEEYSQKVIPMIREEYEKAKVTVGKRMRPSKGAAPDFITPVFKGNGVVFIESGALTGPFQSRTEEARMDSTDVAVVIKDLNTNVAPILNRIIRMDATLSQTSNYQKVWSDRYEGMFVEEEATQEEPTPLATKAEGGAKTDIMEALVQIESSGNPDAVSPVGARGLAQIMPATASNPGFGMKPIDLDTSTPDEQVAWAGEYLNKLKDKLGSTEAALVAYNWGYDNAKKWIKSGSNEADLPEETRGYLAKFKKAGVL